jgi:hypothetical protein
MPERRCSEPHKPWCEECLRAFSRAEQAEAEAASWRKLYTEEMPKLAAALERIAHPPQDKPGPLRQMLSQPYEDARDVARAVLEGTT